MPSIMDWDPRPFSFNIAGGRCEECQGEGVIKGLDAVHGRRRTGVRSCGGKRFRDEMLEVKYRGQSIYDVLEMTVDEAIAPLRRGSRTTRPAAGLSNGCSRCRMSDLGYIKLGQSSSTSPAAKPARKLASFLTKDAGVGRRDVHLRRTHHRAPFPRHLETAGGVQRPDRARPHDRDRRAQHGHHQVGRLGGGPRTRGRGRRAAGWCSKVRPAIWSAVPKATPATTCAAPNTEPSDGIPYLPTAQRGSAAFTVRCADR